MQPKGFVMKQQIIVAVAALALGMVPAAALAQHGGGHGTSAGHGGGGSRGGAVSHGGAASHGGGHVTHGVSVGHAVPRTVLLAHGAPSHLRLGVGVYYGSAYPYGNPYYYGAPYRGYYTSGPGYRYGYGAMGGLRIQGLPPNAEVFDDGYLLGVVDQFDGPLQRLPLEPGPHHIEIRVAGAPPIEFDVNAQPGRTIVYRAGPPYRP